MTNRDYGYWDFNFKQTDWLSNLVEKYEAMPIKDLEKIANIGIKYFNKENKGYKKFIKDDIESRLRIFTYSAYYDDFTAHWNYEKLENLNREFDTCLVEEVMNAVSIPVMAKARIGHITEARVLESMGVDYIDESEVLTPADEEYHLRKDQFTVPFVCGCRNLGEAARRIGEGAAMLRTKGEPGTGNIVEAVRHMRRVNSEVSRLTVMNDDEIMTFAKDLGAPYEVLKQIKDNGRLPVVNFAAGGVATPQDAALMMELGADGVFVGSGIFKSEDPEKFAKAIVQATTHYQDYELIGKLASELGTAMKGLDINQISLEERMQERGW